MKTHWTSKTNLNKIVVNGMEKNVHRRWQNGCWNSNSKIKIAKSKITMKRKSGNTRNKCNSEMNPIHNCYNLLQNRWLLITFISPSKFYVRYFHIYTHSLRKKENSIGSFFFTHTVDWNAQYIWVTWKIWKRTSAPYYIHKKTLWVSYL